MQCRINISKGRTKTRWGAKTQLFMRHCLFQAQAQNSRETCYGFGFWRGKAPPVTLPTQPEVLYQHFLDATVHRRPYTLRGAPPAPASLPANASTSSLPNASDASYYYQEAYAPGSVVPSPVRPVPGGGSSSNTQGCLISCPEQLTYGPHPRFNASSIALGKETRF